MLRYFSVSQFALIEAISLDLRGGLTIVTGETGAGKSLLMDALGILLGGRSSAIVVREGADRAVLQAAFDRPPAAAIADAVLEEILPATDGAVSPDEVILVRELAREGRGRAMVDGVLCPVGRARELGGLLVDLHGQGDQQSLLSPAWQLRYLDGIGGLVPRVEELARRHERLAAVRRERDLVRALHRERDQRLALLTYERDELRKAALREGERDELLETRRLLGGSEKVAVLVAETLALLVGAPEDGAGEGIEDLVGRLGKDMERLVGWSESLAEPAQWVAEFQDRLGEVHSALDRLRERLDFDPAELDRVEGRLHEIDRLERKHGVDVAGLLARLAELERESETLEGASDRLAELEREHGAALAAYLELALELSAARIEAARSVEGRAEGLLRELSMPAARLRVMLARKPATGGDDLSVDGRPCGFDRRGIDDVELLISLNPGESERPLRKVASGGEISRIMLALKLLAASGEGPATLVFDEIDSGVSGRAAEDIGRRLRALASDKQVLCITHLPQVAAFGHHHIEVSKRVEEGRTVVDASYLDGDERREAIARLLAGAEVTDTARRHAAELLARAAAD